MDETMIDETESVASDEKQRVISKTQCGGCNRYFTGMGIFDKHRIGPMTERRCMTEEEMHAAGMDTETCMIRVYRDGSPRREEHEIWYDVAERESIRQRFAKTQMPVRGALSDDTLS